MSVSGRLGCGSYAAQIITRGGGSIVSRLPISAVSWERLLDDTSSGSAQVDDECLDTLVGVKPWKHELAIYRDDVQVWVGPIVNPTAPVQGDHVAYLADARDVSAWWDHRKIHTDHAYVVPTDLATIFQDLATDAMAPDNSPGVFVSTTPCGVLGVLTVLAAQNVIAAQQLRDLAQTGVDWTVVGRDVLAGGVTIPTGSIGTFTNEHFVNPPVPSQSGLAQANAWTVRGSGGGASGDSIYGVDENTDASLEYGLLESVDTVTTIEDYVSALAAAKSRTALTSAVVTVQEAVLTPDAPFTVDELIPGALCNLDLDGPIPVQGEFRLSRVTGTSSGDDGLERIGVTFQPVGTTS